MKNNDLVLVVDDDADCRELIKDSAESVPRTGDFR